MKAAKQILAFLLSFAILLAMIPASAITTFAATENNSIAQTELIDIDIYKAQCLTGVAFDSHGELVARCNNLYSYYVDEELFSPTKTFLDEAYNDDALMAEFALWQTESLGSDVSSAVNTVIQRKDYYEALITGIISSTFTKDTQTAEEFALEVVGTTNTIIDELCNISKAGDKAILIDKLPDVKSAESVSALTQATTKATGIDIGAAIIVETIVTFSETVLDAAERIAAYHAMQSLDVYTKNWLEQMYYKACESNADIALKDALFNLKNSTESFTNAVLIDIKDSSFRLASWSISTTVNVTLGAVAATNPFTAAILAGIKLGKSISDICFATSDVFEQFFLLECIYNIQGLARTVLKANEYVFLGSSTSENAKVFNASVDYYFEAIIATDSQCMIEFLDILYNGGFCKGTIRWIYGATDSYQEAVNVLESFIQTRKHNYDLMIAFYKGALGHNYYDTFAYYYKQEEQIPITDISFMTSRILPPPYPTGYANMIVGDFANIDVQYTPTNTTQRAYIATSDNPDIISIKDNIMTAVSVGTANITVTAVENPDVSYTAEIKVGEKIQDGEIDENSSKTFTYVVNDDGYTATITGLVDGYKPSNLTIPSIIEGHPVTNIADRAFYRCHCLTSVTISNSITSIGELSFFDCSNIKSITIPNSITSVGSQAFDYLLSLEVVYITDLAAWCNIQFDFGSNPLYWANHLCINGVLATDITIPQGVVSIGEGAFTGYHNLTNITIPKSVTSIGNRAFAYCDRLTSIAIPNGVTKIGKSAFANCDSLVSITIPKSITRIDHSAFYDCSKLADVWYEGSKGEYQTIDIGLNNNLLIYANWHYNFGKSCTNHIYDSGKVTKAATCKTTGVKTYTCSVCKGTMTETIAKLTTHTYSNNCDKSCNACGKTRIVGAHKYSNSCDVTCNYCNAKRTIKHTYSNSCDTSCNVCKATRTITHSYKTTTTKATLSKNGSIVKKCTVCGKVASNIAIKYAKSFKLSTTTYTYNGKVKTPTVTVKDSAGKALKKNTDYTVTYASGRKYVGTYKVTIKMKGKYSGTKTLTFKINPPKTTVSKLTAGKKSITVAITKKSTQVTGYQIQYSTSKSFSKATTKTISSYKTTKYTLKSLSAKKTYYVRVRTYKSVGKTKYYSGWSTYKYVKTK